MTTAAATIDRAGLVERERVVTQMLSEIGPDDD